MQHIEQQVRQCMQYHKATEEADLGGRHCHGLTRNGVNGAPADSWLFGTAICTFIRLVSLHIPSPTSECHALGIQDTLLSLSPEIRDNCVQHLQVLYGLDGLVYDLIPIQNIWTDMIKGGSKEELYHHFGPSRPTLGVNGAHWRSRCGLLYARYCT